MKIGGGGEREIQMLLFVSQNYEVRFGGMSTLILPSTQHQQHKRNSARKVPMGVTNPDKD